MSGNRQLTLALLFVNQNDQPDEHHDDGDVVAVVGVEEDGGGWREVGVAGDVEDGVAGGKNLTNDLILSKTEFRHYKDGSK